MTTKTQTGTCRHCGEEIVQRPRWNKVLWVHRLGMRVNCDATGKTRAER